MDIISRPVRSADACAAGLLLAALAADGYEQVHVAGMPEQTVYIEEREALIGVTSAPAPLFAHRLEAIASERRLDIVLVRLNGPGTGISVDLALGSLPCAVWQERQFSLYRDRYSTWLVPPMFGPAVSVTRDGFALEIVPPYSTVAERADGIARAEADLARRLQPLEA